MKRLGQREREEQGHRTQRHHDGGREGVEEVLDGEGGERGAYRERGTDEGDLGRLAHEQAEGRDVAERVAGEGRGERVAQGQA